MAKILLFHEMASASSGRETFDWAREYCYLDELPETEAGGAVFALLELETPVVGQKGQLGIINSFIELNFIKCKFNSFSV